jgi:sortase A
MREKRPLSFFIGNALMAIAVLFLIFIYFPVISLYLFPSPLAEAQTNSSFSISIPKISINSSITQSVDPFNEAEYHEALKKGIAHAKGSALPGEKGTVYLFAHSSGPPWELTRYNTIFFRLGELQNNDEIIIKKDGKKHSYKVTDKKIVWPQDTKYLLQKSNKEQLVLQTCYPIGTDFQRLLIFAVPQ